MKAFVYMIQNGMTFSVKIGMTDRPEVRVHQLQTGCDGPLVLIHTIECHSRLVAGSIEGLFHTILKPWRLRGEWFKDCDAVNAAKILFATLGVTGVRENYEVPAIFDRVRLDREKVEEASA